MNQQNIEKHKFNLIAPSRQREIASMGGKASQEAKKRRKNLRELFAMIGNMEVTDKILLERMEKMGIKKEEATWNLAVVVSTYMNAVKKGDTKTVALILKLMEEDPAKPGGANNEFDEFMREV